MKITGPMNQLVFKAVSLFVFFITCEILTFIVIQQGLFSIVIVKSCNHAIPIRIISTLLIFFEFFTLIFVFRSLHLNRKLKPSTFFGGIVIEILNASLFYTYLLSRVEFVITYFYQKQLSLKFLTLLCISLTLIFWIVKLRAIKCFYLLFNRIDALTENLTEIEADQNSIYIPSAFYYVFSELPEHPVTSRTVCYG